MSTVKPADATKSNSDADADDPKLSILTDLPGVIDKFNALKAAMGAAGLLDLGPEFAIETVAGAGNPDKLRAAYPRTARGAGFTAGAADRGIVSDCTGSWTLELTAAATLGAGWYMPVKSNDGTITVDPNLTETIDGQLTISFGAGESGWIICTGTAFKVLGRSQSSGIRGVKLYNADTGITAADKGFILKATAGTDTTPIVYTFPDAVANPDIYFWVYNASAYDKGIRLYHASQSIGGAAGGGMLTYVPAYTVIGFSANAANFDVFSYSGKNTFRFDTVGTATLNIPPGKNKALISLVAGGGGGGLDGGTPGGNGGTTSVGAIASATGGSGTSTSGAAGFNLGGSPNGEYGSAIATAPAILSGGNSPFGRGAIRVGGAVSIAPTSGYGAGGKSSDSSNESGGGGGGWRLREPYDVTPGSAHTVTIGAGGTANGTGATAGTGGLAIVEFI